MKEEMWTERARGKRWKRRGQKRKSDDSFLIKVSVRWKHLMTINWADERSLNELSHTITLISDFSLH